MTPILVLAFAVVTVQTPYDTVFDQFRNIAPRPDAVAPVHGLVLRRDAMELRLDSGWAYRLTPVAGRTAGIAFVGSGSLSFIPPILVEQFNLKRVMGDSTIDGAITAAVLFFADTTDAELARSLTFGPSAVAVPDAGGAIGGALDYIVDGRTHSADASLLTALLNHATTPYFAAYIERKRGESVMIQYDPNEQEEVSLYRRGKMVGQRIETVCQFERAEDLIHGVSLAQKDPEPLVVTAYDIDATIDGNYKFAAHSTIHFTGHRDRQQWTRLLLYNELEVDSVSSAGEPLTFSRHDHAAPFWVRFAKPVGPGDSVTVRVSYHGNLISFGSAVENFLPPWWDKRRQNIMPFLDSWAFIKSPEMWYPRYDRSQHTTMRLTFHTPKDLKFASIGRLVDSATDGDIATTHWVTEFPTNYASFNIGKFDQLDINDARIPPVTVHVNTEAHRVISKLIPHNARDPEAAVGADIANSLSFFTRVYGPSMFDHYYATEIPYFHGEAFPGLIHLSWATFLSWHEDGGDESFRAHEMAHQWWYYGVEPASYRDAWMSEGFAEFSGLWYMQTVLRDNQKYLKKLRDSRQHIRRERDKAAPLGIGTRAAESWRGNYQLITYEKGAWVLHMLRNMLLNTSDMSEERFVALMHDFYQSYRGKRATTEDFQRVVERHFGQPMDWFFNEWVYGTAIPTYTFSWNAARDSAGVIAQLRVRQSDVPEGFAMFVPVLVKFDQGEAIVRLLVRGATTDAKLRLPAEPRSIELNPLESVLAEVKTEAWQQ